MNNKEKFKIFFAGALSSIVVAWLIINFRLEVYWKAQERKEKQDKCTKSNKNGNRVVRYTCTDGNKNVDIYKEQLYKYIANYR